MSASQASLIDTSSGQHVDHDSLQVATGDALPDLGALVESLGVPYLVEPSAKFQPGKWRKDRCLFGIDLNVLTPAQWQERLQPVLRQLGMLPADQQAFMRLLLAPDAEQKVAPHYLLMGLEGQVTKVYWEHSLAELRHRDPNELLVLYSAWKWKTQQPATVTNYVMAPDAKQANALIQRELQKMPPVVEDLLEQLEILAAFKQTSWPPLTVDVIESESEGKSASPSTQPNEYLLSDDRTSRCSINLHLHHFAPRLGDIAAPIFTLAREWSSVGREDVRAWLAEYGDQMLSNVSLGVDQHAKPFMTFYYGGRVVTPPHLYSKTFE